MASVVDVVEVIKERVRDGIVLGHDLELYRVFNELYVELLRGLKLIKRHYFILTEDFDITYKDILMCIAVKEVSQITYFDSDKDDSYKDLILAWMMFNKLTNVELSKTIQDFNLNEFLRIANFLLEQFDIEYYIDVDNNRMDGKIPNGYTDLMKTRTNTEDAMNYIAYLLSKQYNISKELAIKIFLGVMISKEFMIIEKPLNDDNRADSVLDLYRWLEMLLDYIRRGIVK